MSRYPSNLRRSGDITVSWEYSRSRAMVRASERGVSGVTLRAGGSWRSSTAEKRYLEGGAFDEVDGVKAAEVVEEEIVEVIE